MLRRSFRRAWRVPRLLGALHHHQPRQPPIQGRLWTSGRHEDVPKNGLKPSGSFNDEMGFMESARIVLDPNTPRPRIVGRWDWHLVQFIIALLPAIAIYFLAQYARHVMGVQKEEAEKKEAERRAIAEEQGRQKMEPLVEQSADLQQRVKALEEALEELQGTLPTKASSPGQSSDARSLQSPEPRAHKSPQAPGKKRGPHPGPLTADANGTPTSLPHTPSPRGNPTSPSPAGERGQSDISPSVVVRGSLAVSSEEERGPEEGVAEGVVPKQRGFSVLGWPFWGAASNSMRDGGPAGHGGARAADGDAIDMRSPETGEGRVPLRSDGRRGSGGLLAEPSGVGDSIGEGDAGDRMSGVKGSDREGEIIARGVAGSECAVVERPGDNGGLLERAVQAWRARANGMRQSEARHDADS